MQYAYTAAIETPVLVKVVTSTERNRALQGTHSGAKTPQSLGLVLALPTHCVAERSAERYRPYVGWSKGDDVSARRI